MKKTDEEQRRVEALRQRAARLRAEADRAERELAELERDGGVSKPSTERVYCEFAEPLAGLNLTVTPQQLDVVLAVLRANGLRGRMRRRRKGAPC